MLKKDITLVKRNIKYGGYFVCLPIKWDKQHGKVFIFPGAQKLIILSLALNFCVTLCRLLSTMTSSSGLLDRAQAGIGATAFALSFLIRFDIPIDHVPVQLVNLLLKGNGQSGKKTIVNLSLRYKNMYNLLEIWYGYLCMYILM